jgi:hypothetical protein
MDVVLIAHDVHVVVSVGIQFTLGVGDVFEIAIVVSGVGVGVGVRVGAGKGNGEIEGDGV